MMQVDHATTYEHQLKVHHHYMVPTAIATGYGYAIWYSPKALVANGLNHSRFWAFQLYTINPHAGTGCVQYTVYMKPCTQTAALMPILTVLAWQPSI